MKNVVDSIGLGLTLGALFLWIAQPLPALDTVKAVGSISFGDSMKNVLRKALDEPLVPIPMIELGDGALSPQGFSDLVVEDQDFNLTFYFTGDRLYRVQLDGEEQPSSQFGSIVATQKKVLASVIERRFGQASVTRRVDRDDVKDGGFRTTHHWAPEDIGNNREIWVGIVQTGETFYASLILHHPPLAAQVSESEATSSATEHPRKDISVDELAQNL